MIAYNSTFLRNRAIAKKARQWEGRKLLSAEQGRAVAEKYRWDFYSPNVFIKILLFIFTCILISSGFTMYAQFFPVLFDSSGKSTLIFSCILFSVLCVGGLEILIKKNNIYRAGIDEGLLYSALGFTSVAIGLLFGNALNNNSDAVLFFLILTIPFLLGAVIRYADVFISLLLILCLYAVFFLLLLKLGEIAKMIMPFALMTASAPMYLFVNRQKKRDKLFFWKNCLLAMECIALLVFYMACNYYVIRESSIAFFDLNLNPGEDIPLAMVFYLLTAAVPFLYVWYGLRKKDKVLLWVGLLLVAMAALTFKNYFSLGHPEIVLTLAGSVMILTAYFSIRYLKINRYGITDAEDEERDNVLRSNAEALIIAQSFGQGKATGSSSGTDLGGGDFGGAGAGGKF